MSLSTPKTVTIQPVLYTLLMPIFTIAGLVVLIALHDVSQIAGLPIIAGLAGVHAGAAVANASA